MASIALSAFLEVLIENMTSIVLKERELQLDLEKDANNLLQNLSLIELFLAEAGEGSQANNTVWKWLDMLRVVAYDANDLMDNLATEAQRRQLIHFSKVRNSISIFNPKRIIFRHKAAHDMKNIMQSLEDITKRRNLLGLTVSDKATQRDDTNGLLQTTSMPSSTFHPLGREGDQRRVINLLVGADRKTSGTISVVPIIGIGGLGKTTLAQLVYNDETVERHFGLRLWIHVSRDFNVNKIMKSMIESIDLTACDQSISLDILQKQLRQKLRGRRYLLVLDDVWNEKPKEWESLVEPLLNGAKGSMILVTTRIVEVSRLVMGYSAMQHEHYNLKGLSDDDCWSLFYQRAVGANSYLDPNFGNIRYEIVNKCKGLPSAAEAISFRLRRETDQSKWGSILRNEMSDFYGDDSDITYSTRMSYQHLPAHLKPCFAYCSIIPKGFVFDKETLVQLWMSQNFLRGVQMEEDGGHYFDSLVERLFFEFSHFDYRSNTPKYTIHSVIHDFARLISGEECYVLDSNDQQQHNVSDKTRHASIVYGESKFMGSRELSKSSSSSSLGMSSPSMGSRKLSPPRQGAGSMFERVYGCKGLYTLLAIGGESISGLQVPEDLAKRLKCLRALDMSNSGISQLPDSIGKLKHLRYLQLRSTNIKKLPDSLCCLYNLQTLGLANCYDLKELPKDTHFLRKLRHLDMHLDDDNVTSLLMSMPQGLGELTALRTLSRFVVSQDNKKALLSEMRNLNNLTGKLHISNLDLVLNPKEAEDANLSNKTNLHQLVLQWGNNSTIWSSRVGPQVFELFQPATSLKELKIVGYKGANFPSWIGNTSFTNLVTVELSGCKGCVNLPPLGQLPLLKALFIKSMDSVVLVDCQLCGQGHTKFPSLEKLHFERMSRLQAWASLDEACELPVLQELVFKECGDLRQLTHKYPRLKKLVIEGSPWLLGLPTIPSLQSLDVKASSEKIWQSVPHFSSLSSLAISQLGVKTVPLGQQGPASLRRLEITHCGELEFLPDNVIPVGLTFLAIKHCPQLRCLPRRLRDVEGLATLEIEDCGQLRTLTDCLPRGLEFLSIDNCPELSGSCQGPEWGKIAGLASVWIDKQPVIIAWQGNSSDGGIDAEVPATSPRREKNIGGSIRKVVKKPIRRVVKKIVLFLPRNKTDRSSHIEESIPKQVVPADKT